MAENTKNIIEALRLIASEADDALTTSDKEELCFALENARDWLYLAASALELVKRERDAALTDLWNMSSCEKCKHKGSRTTDDSKCGDCRLGVVPDHPELTHRTN